MLYNICDGKFNYIGVLKVGSSHNNTLFYMNMLHLLANLPWLDMNNVLKQASNNEPFSDNIQW